MMVRSDAFAGVPDIDSPRSNFWYVQRLRPAA
jgi:hypothetical protein